MNKQSDTKVNSNLKQTSIIMITLLILSIIFTVGLSVSYDIKVEKMREQEQSYFSSNQYAMKMNNQLEEVLDRQLLQGYLFTGKTSIPAPNTFYISIKDKNNKETYTNIPLIEKPKLENSKDNMANVTFTLNQNMMISDIKQTQETQYQTLVKNAVIKILQNDDSNTIEGILDVYNFQNKIDTKTNAQIYISPTGYKFDKDGKMINQVTIPPNASEDDKIAEQTRMHQAQDDMDNILIALKNREKRIENSPYTIQIIIPKTILANASADDFIQYTIQNALLPGGLLFLIIFIITVLIAAFTPLKKQNQSRLVRGFNNTYLGIKFFLIGMITGIESIFALGGIFSLNQISMLNTPREEVIMQILKFNENPYYYFLGILYSFTILLITYLFITYFKYIYYNGIINGLFKKTIIGAACYYVYTKLKTAVTIKYNPDYKKTKSKIIKILALNIVIILALTVLLNIRPKFLILVITIIYSYLIYKKALEHLAKIEDLEQATDKLAQGNFTTQIHQDGLLSKTCQNLNQITQGFKDAVDREVKSQNLKTQLISNVSHDLKTPLTSIINYSDLMQDTNNTKEQQQQYAQIIHQKSQRLKILIEDLFEASKATSGDIEMHKEPLDVLSVLRQTLGELNEKIETSQIEFVLNLPEHKIISQIDGLRTYRVFANIISNIIKYSLPNTRAYISCEEKENYVTISFKNIANYKMDFDNEIITQRFQRGDQSRTVEGSGLGLAIAKSLMELQDGKIKIQTDADLFTLQAIFLKVPEKQETQENQKDQETNQDTQDQMPDQEPKIEEEKTNDPAEKEEN